MRKFYLSLIVVLCLLNFQTNAQSLTEVFNYTAGDNIGSNSNLASGGVNNNWTTHSNTAGNANTINVLSGSLSYPGLLASTGNRINMPGSNATLPRDVNRPTGVAAGTTLAYCSFLVNVIDATQLATSFSDNTYFFSFGNTSGSSVTTLYARVGIRSTNGGTSFRLGIQNTTGGTPTYTEYTTDLAFGSTHLVVVKYDFNGASNDIATLWVNPGSLGTTEPGTFVSNNSGTATTPNTFSSVALRNSANTPKVDIDELRVGTTWAQVTPATASATVSVAPGNNGNETGPVSGTFNINLSTNAPAGGVTVNYSFGSVAANEASEGVDYTASPASSVFIPPGSNSASVSLTITDDGLFEGTEIVTLTLGVITNGFTAGVPSSNNISILDNDAPPTVSVTSGVNASEPATNGTFVLSLSQSAPAGGVTVNYTLTGSASQGIGQDYTDPQNGTVTIPFNSNSVTIQLMVNDDLNAEGTETITITLNSATAGYGIGTGSSSISLFDNDNPPIVINEVYGGGGNGGSTWTHDFIELYNNGNIPYNLSGYSVQYASSTGSSWTPTALSGIIPAHGYYLIQEGSGGGGTAALPTPDATGGIAMSATAGKVILVNTTVAQTGTNPTGNAILDKVGYGSANGFEGAAASAPSATTSIQRSPAGFDTDHNNTDFVVLSMPTPKNSVVDLIPPVVSSLYPADNATNTTTSMVASITFNENIQLGTGSIYLRRLSDNGLALQIPVNTANITVSGAKASFIVQGLGFSTPYYFEVDAGAFKDLDDNLFIGIAGNNTWNFSTNPNPVAAVGTSFSFNVCTQDLPDGFTFFSETGPQIWGCSSFGRNAASPPPHTNSPNGVEMNGFANNTNIPNADWLISPSYNLTGTIYPLLSFWTRTAFSGLPLQLRVSTNYNGGDPRLATWTDINGHFPPPESNVWTESSQINLAAYKHPNVHFAFFYVSDDEEGARWTVDDIAITNSLVPPPPTLTVSSHDLQFPYVAAGSSSTKTFTFIGNDLTDGVTINSSGVFQVSKDGSVFSNSISYSLAEANDQSKTVWVRYSPSVNNVESIETATISTSGLTEVVNLNGSSTHPSGTLEVVNWNLEWFGSPLQDPANDNLQEQNVKTILQNIGADIYGVVEVVDEPRLANVVSQMPGYSYIVGQFGSHVNPPEPNGSSLSTAQKLGFIYKTSLFSNITTRPMINLPYTSDSYNNWSGGRYPFLFTADLTLNCVTTRINFVLVHAKANTNPTNEAYARREASATELHDTLMTYFANEKVIMLGDFNDDLDRSITAGFTTTSYHAFTTDNSNFFSPTLALSNAGKRSTVGFNDMIDHVILTNDIQPYYMSGTANVLSDVSELVNDYGTTTTDHYPVFTRYKFELPAAPTISCPSNIISVTDPNRCDAVITYTVGYQSNCGAGTLEQTAGLPSGSMFPKGTTTNSFKFTDAAGQIVTCSFDVIISDHEGPSLVNPEVGCSSLDRRGLNQCLSYGVGFDPNSLESTVAALYKDNCSEVVTATWTSTTPGEANTNCNWSFTFHYTITDGEGNSVTCDVTYAGGDRNPPGGSPPSSIGILSGCKPSEAQAAALFDAGLAAHLYHDNCNGPVTAIMTGVAVSGTNCSWTVTFTFSVKDQCDNILPSQTYTKGGANHNLPTGHGPAELTGVSGCKPTTSQAAADFDAAYAVSEFVNSCGGPVTAILKNVIVGGTNCNWGVTYLYDVEDECHNKLSNRSYIRSGRDTEAPKLKSSQIGCATLNRTNMNTCAAQAVSSESISQLSRDVEALYEDNCSINITAYPTVIPDPNNNNCQWSFLIQFRIADACGNETQCEVTRSGGDKNAPVLRDENIRCNSLNNIGINNCLSYGNSFDAHSLEASVAALYQDDCGQNVTATLAGTTEGANNSDCSWSFTYHFRIEDDCGNFVMCDVIYSGRDLKAPTASNPATVHVSCITDIPAPDPAVVTDAVDNCGTVHVELITEVNSGGTGCSYNPYVVTRLYRVSDNCGNYIVVQHKIIAVDDVKPTASNPAPVTVQCISNIPVADPAVVIDEADNCSATTVSLFVETNNGGSGCANDPYIVTRRYRIYDACGNFKEVTHTLTAKDETAPQFTAPADKTILFTSTYGYDASVSNTGNYSNASDNCGGTVTVTYADQSVQCGNNILITRTWTAKDPCNNSLSKVQTITVTDNSTPYIIYAASEAKFGENNFINGDVGVTATNGKAEFKKNSVLDPYHVYAKNITVQLPASVNNRHFMPATGGPTPPFYFYSGGGLAGNHTQNANGVVPAGNFKNLTIKKNVVATVNGNNYGTVTIEEGAVVTFTSGNINMEELQVKKGRTTALTQVIFTQQTGIQIKDRVRIEENARVNISGPKVILYLGDAKKDEENFQVKGDNTAVTLNIMIPNGKLKINGGSTNAVMTGWFIVEKLESDGKNVTWNPYDCAPAAIVPRWTVESRSVQSVPVITGFRVTVSPNPSADEFRIYTETASDESITLRIFDLSGKTVQQINKANANTFISVGQLLKQGIYFAEVRQGQLKQTVKLVKVE